MTLSCRVLWQSLRESKTSVPIPCPVDRDDTAPLIGHISVKGMVHVQRWLFTWLQNHWIFIWKLTWYEVGKATNHFENYSVLAFFESRYLKGAISSRSEQTFNRAWNQCPVFKRTIHWHTCTYMDILTDFDPCSHRRVLQKGMGFRMCFCSLTVSYVYSDGVLCGRSSGDAGECTREKISTVAVSWVRFLLLPSVSSSFTSCYTCKSSLHLFRSETLSQFCELLDLNFYFFVLFVCLKHFRNSVDF